MNITDLTPHQLRQAADLQEQIQGLKSELNQLLGAELPSPFVTEAPVSTLATSAKKGRKKFSAESRAKMAAAQKARWAAKKSVQETSPEAIKTPEPVEKPKKKKASPALLKALAKARAARAAKLKAEKGTTKDKATIIPAFRNARSDAAKAMWAKRRAEKAKKAAETTPF